MRRSRTLAVVLAAMVACSGAGWVAGRSVRSPADIATDAAPPPPSLITAPVESRTLSTTVTGRGTVRYGEPTPVALTASGTGGANLVTRGPAKGSVLAENDVAMEVDGRPVRVLQGDTPMYRDIRPGDSGDDVRQLEEAMQRLGFDPGPVDGVYDLATQSAVIAWYGAAGYDAQGASDEEAERLRSAQQTIKSAQDQVLSARSALRTASKGTTAAELEQAELDLTARRREVEAANDTLVAAQAAEAPAVQRAAIAADELTDLDLDNRIAVSRAQAELQGAQDRVEEAYTAKSLAEQTLQRDLTTFTPDDPSTPENEYRRTASDAQIAEDRAAVERAVNAATQADAALAIARLALSEAEGANADKLAQAQLAVTEADIALAQARATTRSAQRGLDAANDGVRSAELRLVTLRTPPDVGSAREQLANAERDLADAIARGGDLLAEVGIVVPADEVLFQPTLPVRVDEVKAARGDSVKGEVMVVTTSRLAVDGSVSIPDSRLVAVGDKVELTSTELGVTFTGTVSKLAAKAGTDGADAQKVYLEITPDDPPADLVGAAVGFRIEVTSTAGEVMAVPVAAVSTDSDGQARVLVARPDGTTTAVPVTTGLSAQGFVEVTADGLAVGDEVVVGSTGLGADGSETDGSDGAEQAVGS